MTSLSLSTIAFGHGIGYGSGGSDWPWRDDRNWKPQVIRILSGVKGPTICSFRGRLWSTCVTICANLEQCCVIGSVASIERCSNSRFLAFLCLLSHTSGEYWFEIGESTEAWSKPNQTRYSPQWFAAKTFRCELHWKMLRLRGEFIERRGDPTVLSLESDVAGYLSCGIKKSIRSTPGFVESSVVASLRSRWYVGL